MLLIEKKQQTCPLPSPVNVFLQKLPYNNSAQVANGEWIYCLGGTQLKINEESTWKGVGVATTISSFGNGTENPEFPNNQRVRCNHYELDEDAHAFRNGENFNGITGDDDAQLEYGDKLKQSLDMYNSVDNQPYALHSARNVPQYQLEIGHEEDEQWNYLS